jgi:hypothetical protein
MHIEKEKRFLGLLLLLVASLIGSEAVHADIEWKRIRQMNLPAQPLDIATAPDHQWIFVLVPGEVLVYAFGEDKTTKRIPVDKNLDQITYAVKSKSLILTSRSTGKLEIIQLERIYSLDISDLPFKGSEDSPVTIAVFSDYQ